MKNKEKMNPFLRIFLFAAILVIVAVVAAIGLFYYFFGIPEPEGLSLASWPQVFTDSFSTWMENVDGTLNIEDIALERLDEYGLWVQVLDESGREVFAHNKPANYPSGYPASELASFSTSAYENGNTVFVGRFEEDGQTWNYLIGFPYAIGKYMLYYNGENVGRLSPVFRALLCFSLGIIFIFVLAYGFWLTHHLAKITNGIAGISRRCYSPLPQKGMFHEVYQELNKMDDKIQTSDKTQKDTERTRREWIANITHDLKTPLSPIMGYAELLSDGSVPNGETMQEYGKIILKNANHAQKLINDLKLTYQLESGAIPYHPQEIQFVRFVRETVIDIINDPVFCNRQVEFESDVEEMTAFIDAGLFRRVLANLIVNALVHNPPETKVSVLVNSQHEGKVSLIVRDNGTGMDEEQQLQLFNRYYRGTNTQEKPEGSGLGLAIARQIMLLHGGDISVKSRKDEGSEFVIKLP